MLVPSSFATSDSPPEREILLRLEDVGRSFQMGDVTVEALRDVTLDVYSGELLVLLGPSGSGKTTLLNLLGGMDSPTSGTVWFREQELSAMSRRELTLYRRNEIGFVFQFYNLVPNLTARENVMVSIEISSNPLDADEALRLVDLADRADHFPSQLSGGEQQRVAIARALAKNPEMLMCDEPTGALDFKTGKQILGLLVELKETLGKTILIITHNVAISQLADRTVRLRSGDVVEVHRNEHPLPPEEITW